MAEFRMPSLGADMERGKVVEWLAKPGDYVHRGDIIAAVDTEKTVMEVESFEDGVLAEYLVDLGETVPVGTPIARLTGTPADVEPRPVAAGGAGGGGGAGGAGGAGAAGAGARREPGRTRAPAPKGAPSVGTEPIEAEEEPAHVTPPIRHFAQQLGVDLEQVHGTGKHGAITRADVQAVARAARAAREAAETAGAAVGRVPASAGARGAPTSAAAVAAAHAGRVRSSPRARRLAGDLGVDLTSITGTGPEGAVTEADVRREAGAHPAEAASAAAPAAASAAAPAAAPAHSGAEPPAAPAGPASEAAQRTASLRRAIGSLMARSKREIPHYYLSTTIDLSSALTWMQQANAGRPIAARLVPAALLLAASARAAKEVPEVNGFFVDGEFRPSTAVHLGVAVALRGGGLVAPAIHDADTLGIDALMEQLRDLVARARAGRLQRTEMADPTITVTNLGDLGVESVFGVIYAPQVALVGFGRVVEQPWAHEGMLGVRPVVTATLSADHRVSDGLRGGRFLARIDELLQKPEEL